jgi:hypothetical protein
MSENSKQPTLYDAPESMICEIIKENDPVVWSHLEEMFQNHYGLDKIILHIKRGHFPKAIEDNLIRAFKWKYIEMIDKGSS